MTSWVEERWDILKFLSLSKRRACTKFPGARNVTVGAENSIKKKSPSICKKKNLIFPEDLWRDLFMSPPSALRPLKSIFLHSHWGFCLPDWKWIFTLKSAVCVNVRYHRSNYEFWWFEGYFPINLVLCLENNFLRAIMTNDFNFFSP